MGSGLGAFSLRVFCWAVAALSILSAAPALSQDVERTALPDWIAPSTRIDASSAAAASDAPIRILDVDRQIRFTAEGSETFIRRRIKVLNQQGLELLSTVSGTWAPPRQALHVHTIRIERDGQSIDVLDGQTFEILRRENNLSQSMLDGALTATLQPRDLRVGDILETAFTIVDNGGVLAPHQEALDGLTSGWPMERAILRITWPAAMAMRFKLPSDWPAATPRRTRDGWEVVVERRDVQPARRPDNLPARYYLDDAIEVTDLTDWAATAALVSPFYDRASTLDAGSPLNAEIERIRAAHATPLARAAAALRLVQDDIRYVALAMGEGGYVPASADAVWRSRYGDCKGKTALLLALLHGLDIEAEPALVSTTYGDGLDQRLPLMGWFDHILVRANVDGKTYWLDGTKVGDRDLDLIPPPPFDWALPVRAEGAALERIVVPPAAVPSSDITMTVDASGGLDTAAKLTMDMAYTGDAATAFRERLASITPEQLRTSFAASMDDNDSVEFEGIESRYDEATNTFHLVMTGTVRMAWLSGSGGRLLSLSETAFQTPYQAERVGLLAAFKDDPYTLAYPYMVRQRTRVILPNGGEGFRLEGADRTVEIGGFRQQRTGVITGGVADVVATTTSLVPEITSAEMDTARTRAENDSDAGARIRAPADYRSTTADLSRIDPTGSDVEALLDRAKSLSANGDATGALALLDAAIEREPDNVAARLARGEAHLDADDLAGARADYDRAVELDPADDKALKGQAWTAIRDGRAAEAVVSYAVALRLDPSDVNALWGRAMAYYQIGRVERALDDYRALKVAAPDSDAGIAGEMRALVRLNRDAEVRTLVAARLAENPVDTVALDGGLDLAIQRGDSAWLLPAMDTAVAASPDNVELRSLRGQARVLAGRDDDARQDFAFMRAQGQGDPEDLNNVCWAQAISGFDLDLALADCDAAIAAAPAASFIDSRAMALLQMERYAEAKTAYDQAIEGQPDQTSSLFGRGLARKMLGDADGAADISRALLLSADTARNFEVFLRRHPDLRP